jgi:hypothetical protein
VLSLVTKGVARLASEPGLEPSGNPMQIVAKAREYFALHLQEPIEMTAVPQALGISQDCLNVCFEQVPSCF